MSQPTVSRWENTPTLRDLVRLGRVMVDLYCQNYAAPPEAIVLDIDDTVDVIHGNQQLSLFNALALAKISSEVGGLTGRWIMQRSIGDACCPEVDHLGSVPTCCRRVVG
jgi:hypothetical protein